jgi:hypothetical protein
LEDEEKYNTVRMWGHSHHSMGVSPSGQDDTQFNTFIERFNGEPINPYFIRVIMNNKGVIKADIYDEETGVRYDNVDVQTMPVFEESFYAELQKEVDANYEILKTQTQTNVAAFTGATLGYTPQTKTTITWTSTTGVATEDSDKTLEEYLTEKSVTFHDLSYVEQNRLIMRLLLSDEDNVRVFHVDAFDDSYCVLRNAKAMLGMYEKPEPTQKSRLSRYIQAYFDIVDKVAEIHGDGLFSLMDSTNKKLSDDETLDSVLIAISDTAFKYASSVFNELGADMRGFKQVARQFRSALFYNILTEYTFDAFTIVTNKQLKSRIKKFFISTYELESSIAAELAESIAVLYK